MKSIFRKASLEKLSSPEQLDKLVQLTSPRSWMTVAFFVIIVVSMVIWGIVGVIPKKYQGQGIMISSGGTVAIQSKVSGVISDVRIKQGDFVYKGDIIARIDQSDVIKEIEKLEKQLEELKNKNNREYMNKIKSQDIEINKKIGEISNQSISIEDSFFVKEEAILNLKRLEADLIKRKKLYDSGVISNEEYEKYIKERDKGIRAKDNAIYVYEQSIKNKEYLELELAQLEFGKESLEKEISTNYEEKTINRNIINYKNKLTESNIFSTIEGKVLGVNINKYNIVQPGMTVATILQKGKNVNETSVLFYLPIEQGKRLKMGMSVNVYPTAINRQEYGHMEAVITEVSEYAVTASDIRETLGNDELANKFMKMGVLVEVKSNILKDKNTKSGFYWSGKKGKTIEINEGTICDVSVTTEENRPISLVIPLLKEKLLP